MDKYYLDKEKEVLINYFVTEGHNCKKDFKDYIDSYVKQHGEKVADKFKDRTIHSAWNELGNYELEDVNYFWGNENNDNLVTYVYSQPKFVPTTTKINNLDKLKVNWSHVTNKGENFLFYTRMYYLKQTKDLIAEKNIDTNLINHDGEVFFTHIFDNYCSKSKDMHDVDIEDVRLVDTMNLIGDYHYLLEKMDIEKIKYMQNKFHLCVDIIEQKFYQIATRENANKEPAKQIEISYEKDKLNDQLPFRKHRIYLDKIFNYHLMNKKYVFDESKDNPKRLKI